MVLKLYSLKCLPGKGLDSSFYTNQTTLNTTIVYTAICKNSITKPEPKVQRNEQIVRFKLPLKVCHIEEKPSHLATLP